MSPHGIISQRLEASLKSRPSWCGAESGDGEAFRACKPQDNGPGSYTVTMALQRALTSTR